MCHGAFFVVMVFDKGKKKLNFVSKTKASYGTCWLFIIFT